MSMSSSRIAEFLSRAQVINSKAKAVEAGKSPLSMNRTSNNSPLVGKNTMSPISNRSFQSTNEDTPVPSMKKVVLSGTFTNKKTVSASGREKLDRNFSKPLLPKVPKENFQELKETIKKKPPFPLSKQTNSEEKTKSKTIAISELEEKSKKKMQKMLEIFKEEALKMDEKLKVLQEENIKLKRILNNPQLPQAKPTIKTIKTVINHFISQLSCEKYSQVLDDLCISYRKSIISLEVYDKIHNWFECLDIEEENYDAFLASVCKKIEQEERKRLRTEEDTGKMIEYEENLIRELEMRVNYAENLARRGSCRLISDPGEEESPKFDRNKVLGNLNVLLQKTQ
ncbi:hypothetical protein SteCoe_30628 [Stentor coeruleus]|uniref:Uncharacterized protein n=1 Tax=Stentor coeruleus TaxID=5963 RepID=A0A1R2B379_9CILI|nr:hypothetical protein SteCoe_30628 [Stentor coeruleus]